MKIVADCRYIRVNHPDGISRFTVGIVSALSRLHDVTVLICSKEQLGALPELPYAVIPSPTSVREPLVARLVNRLAPDVVFTPMQTMGSRGRKYALILTVHDLIYYTHRQPPRSVPVFVRILWRLYHLTWWPQRFLLNRADLVATVSSTTADLLRAHKLTRRPIVIVSNASGAELPPPQQQPLVREKILIYMGSFMPYKNVDALVRAAALLPDYVLHLLSPIDEKEKRRLETIAPTAQLVFHNGVSEQKYVDLLVRATGLMSASREEGFGIPLIEAMSHGTPVVVSDIPIFHEIGGAAATYFNPDQPETIAQAVRDLSKNWNEKSERSLSQASLYSWESSASALLAAMQTLDRAPTKQAGL